MSDRSQFLLCTAPDWTVAPLPTKGFFAPEHYKLPRAITGQTAAETITIHSA